MKKLKNYLPMHFTVFLIIGILVQFYTKFWTFNFQESFSIFLVLALLLLIRNRFVTTILTAIIFFNIGVFSVFITDDTNYDSYYQHHLKAEENVILKIKKILKSGNYSDKYEAEVIQIQQQKTIGIVLLNVQKDSLYNSLKVDDLIDLKPEFLAINPPLNPHQFNYKCYLAKQGIHQQIFTENNRFLILKSQSTTLVGLSAKFRDLVQESLKKYYFKEDELSVINALLLGQRQGISKELIANYSRAGAIHILAVSGLHVGVILLMLSFIFKPLERIQNGKYLKTIIIIFLLWVFAFIAGLSASVVRAVTMFTFLAVGLSFKKKNVVFFSLVSSLFFLLIIKPMFLFDVGFQLSYLAVFGIIWVQPKLYQLIQAKVKILDKIWQLFTVSIAAQIGILPLSIYYFEQIPGLFLASNLVIIPFLMYILLGGILVIITSLLNILPQFMADLYGVVISLMNNFVSWISHQEAFLFKEISISFLWMLAWYALIVFSVDFLIQKKQKKLIAVLIAILGVQSIYFYETKKNKNKEELIVFHKSRSSIIGERTGEKLLLQHDLDSIEFKDNFSIKSYRVSERISKTKAVNFNNFIQFTNKNILLVDSLGVYQFRDLKNPIILLQYSPKINLERLIKTIKPSQIIADGSNYKSYVFRWEETSNKQKTPFFYTGKNGAYILK
ncbi:ComEC/Rec2 family competence protein [Polaribacter haliotis]|uniref:ComEC/Rec2 family competence protein n=1 Tax=Polaribacter haliotis TaxID=1888915 RepID=A0A7L8AEB8_9FLAO|nr:ComEC/Rec2 family competence protein [Polaribacter haliotis]QOD60353.1 ComEC/Rec2 family competence protein [Polaribacter haliotis]